MTQIVLAGYSEAVDQFFGPLAKYGQLKKEYRNATMQYTPSEMVGTERKAIFGIYPDKLWSICTSHVEHHNLAIRTLIKRFTRRPPAAMLTGVTKELWDFEPLFDVRRGNAAYVTSRKRLASSEADCYKLNPVEHYPKATAAFRCGGHFF